MYNEIKKGLLPKYKDIEITVLDSIDSTNLEAKRLIANGLCDTAIIIANEQTNGRGRLGRSFYSPPSTGIYMSIVVQPKMTAFDALIITICTGVAVCQAINALTGKNPQIKWVNDIFLDGKKVCGILAEAVGNGVDGQIGSVVIGIGLNVTTVDFPDDIKDIASGINAHNVPKSRFVSEIINRLLSMLDNLDRQAIMEQYRSLSLVMNKTITYVRNGVEKNGNVINIDDEGRLLVETDSGIDVLCSGEISLGSSNFTEK